MNFGLIISEWPTIQALLKNLDHVIASGVRQLPDFSQ